MNIFDTTISQEKQFADLRHLALAVWVGTQPQAKYNTNSIAVQGLYKNLKNISCSMTNPLQLAARTVHHCLKQRIEQECPTALEILPMCSSVQLAVVTWPNQPITTHTPN
ncbi:hypothetical protein PoB_006776800 [Plakobranchus ocellatus]|uniref:Uncharacterized protein n=1 Tax=Plakobranchus ocellatus TaxID=259542 RepID=A0AAV4DAH4_9GAST|nr:hypothetical protein PoB_006776800 [Plakobranchus ocellatus]